MNKNTKTNAVRLLEQAHIAYKAITYEVDESNLSATHLCASLGLLPEQVYKSIVIVSSHNNFAMGLVPADAEIDLKKMAKALGEKSCTLLPLKDLQKVTGYIRGGCSPIGLKKPLPIILDQTMKSQKEVYISAGKRGIQICISPLALQNFLNASFIDIRKEA